MVVLAAAITRPFEDIANDAHVEDPAAGLDDHVLPLFDVDQMKSVVFVIAAMDVPAASIAITRHCRLPGLVPLNEVNAPVGPAVPYLIKDEAKRFCETAMLLPLYDIATGPSPLAP